jgi:hypothetical protein
LDTPDGLRWRRRGKGASNAGCQYECQSQSDGTGECNSQQKHRRRRGPEFRINNNGTTSAGAARKVHVLRSKSERGSAQPALHMIAKSVGPPGGVHKERNTNSDEAQDSRDYPADAVFTVDCRAIAVRTPHFYDHAWHHQFLLRAVKPLAS